MFDKKTSQVFLSILSLVSKEFGVKFSDLKMAEFAVTPDEIMNLHTQSERDKLLENTSNKDARMKQFKIIENENGALAQLYWKKYSSFMIDLIAAQAQSEMISTLSDFNLKLGLSRHLIGLFTEGIRNSCLQIFEDITNITEQYKHQHFISPYKKQCETYGLFRHTGIRFNNPSLVVQAHPDGYHELKETIREDEDLWPSTLLPQLKDKIDQQQHHLRENYTYCFKVGETTYYSNMAKEEMHPDALKQIQTLLSDIYWRDQVITHVVVDVQSTRECYLEVLAKHETNSKIPCIIVDQERRHHYYFPNRFIVDNEGRGFYLGYVSDSDFCVDDLGTTKKMIICTHSSIHTEMDSIVHKKYIEVLKALDTRTDTKMFLNALFCYSYLYIKVMPYARGSAAITEWLMRGLAKAKGIDLGPFSKGISWDFSAFICISAEKFAAKYEEYFSKVSLLPTNHRGLVPIVQSPNPAVEKITPSSACCC